MISPDFPDARKRFRMNRRERRRQAKEAKGASKGGKAAEHGLRAEQLAGEGQIEEAIKAYQQAISINPQFAAAHHNLGVLLRRQGLLNEAIESYTRATAIQPDYVDAHYNLGNALLGLGNLDAAVASYHKALAIKPNFTQAYNNLGNVFSKLGKLEDAVTSYHQALAINPDYAEAHNNLGNVFKEMDRIDDAVKSYRQAVKLEPAYQAAHENLIKVRWSQGEGGKALSDLRAAYENDPVHPRIKRLLTRYLIEIDDLAKAQEIIDNDPSLSSGDAEGFCFQGIIYEKNGDYDAAMENYSEAYRANPSIGNAFNEIKMKFFKGDIESAINQVDGICDSRELDRLDLLSFVALKTHMLKAAKSKEYSELCDYDAFVFSEKIDVPTGWPDLESFNADLASELESLHTDKFQPIDQSLRNGTQTVQNLFRANRNPVIDALQAAITAKIEKYIGTLPSGGEHVFLGNVPDEITYIISWSVRLHSEGFHANHIHPAGWLSSAYYVSLPPEVGGDDESKAGWLKFGEPPAKDNIYNLSPDMWVKPQAGQLVLFPSYFWHGTEPFQSDDPRLTVAFDIAGKI